MLSVPGTGWLLASAIVARIPLGMSSLAILLFIRQRTGSFVQAGLMVGGYGVANAIASPALGRIIDRVGQRTVLAACAVAQACFTTMLVLVEHARLGSGIGLGMTILAGASTPPVSGCLRALWPRLVAAEALDSAFAVDAISQELVWTLGPLLVAGITAIFASADAVLACGAVSLIGTLWFISVPLVGRYGGGASEVVPATRTALSSPGLRVVLVTMLLFGVATGQLEVAIPALAREIREPGFTGVMLAVWSIGSMVGGSYYGTRHWQGTVGPRFRALMFVLAACILPLGFATSLPIALGAALTAGAPNSPWLACEFSLIGALAPAGRSTEAFTFNQSAVAFGVAAGAALGGGIVDLWGTRATVLVSCAVVFAAACAAVMGRAQTDSEAPPTR